MERAHYEKLRHLLRHDLGGVEKVIRSLNHLRRKQPDNKCLAEVSGYFRNNHHRMGYMPGSKPSWCFVRSFKASVSTRHGSCCQGRTGGKSIFRTTWCRFLETDRLIDQLRTYTLQFGDLERFHERRKYQRSRR